MDTEASHPHLVLYPKVYLDKNKHVKELIPCDGRVVDRKSLPDALLLDTKYTKLLKPFDSITTYLDDTHPEKEHLTTGRIISDSNILVGNNYAFYAFIPDAQSQWVCKLSSQIPVFIGYIFHKSVQAKTLVSIEIIPKSSRTFGNLHYTHAPKNIRVQGTMQSSSDGSVQWHDIPQSKMMLDRNMWKYGNKATIVLPKSDVKYHGYRLIIHDWYIYPDSTDTSEYSTACGLNYIHFTFKEDKDQVVLPEFTTPDPEQIFTIDYRPFTLEMTMTKESFEQMASALESKMMNAINSTKPTTNFEEYTSSIEHLVREDIASTSLQDAGEIRKTYIYYSKTSATPSTPLVVYLPNEPKPFTYRMYVNYQRNNSDIVLKIPEDNTDVISKFNVCLNNSKYGEGKEITLKGFGSYVILHHYAEVWHGILYNSYVRLP